MTRDDQRRFQALDVDFESIGLMEPGVPQPPYFCDPVDAEFVGRIGCDGIHFILLPGDERVFCVDPVMGEPGAYVLPVAENFRQFLSFVLYCRDASPIAQIRWMEEARFRQLLKEDAAAERPGCAEFFAKRDTALQTLAQTFGLAPADPYRRVKALQADFAPSVLRFSDEYRETLGF